MPAVTRTPRSQWIAAGLQALASGGPDAVRVEALATGLGVTKGGFYGYFADRTAFLHELLDEWERRSTADVLARVEAKGGGARAKIRRAGALTFSAELLPVDLAVRSWSRHDSAVGARLRRVDNARLDYLRSLFAGFVDDPDEVEARNTLAFALAIGQLHGRRPRSAQPTRSDQSRRSTPPCCARRRLKRTTGATARPRRGAAADDHHLLAPHPSGSEDGTGQGSHESASDASCEARKPIVQRDVRGGCRNGQARPAD